jgi:hypothetical protein
MGRTHILFRNTHPFAYFFMFFMVLTNTFIVSVEHVISSVITTCENAFINGRKIMDGVKLLYQILEKINLNKYKVWCIRSKMLPNSACVMHDGYL